MSKKNEDPQLENEQSALEMPSEGQAADQDAAPMPVAAPAQEHNVLEDIALKTKREHNLDRVYVTSDGTAFYTRHDAHNHARNLADDTIVAIEPLEDK